MPCFKGIAVSIHANGAPLPEYGIQKQGRSSRINSYIPVPQPQLSAESGKTEPAKFAISITLLTPKMPIPYSTPKATPANPYPRPQLVGDMPMSGSNALSFTPNGVAPYTPVTRSENETIAAYIYFDGRAKEEVATLLRPSEETWVNSRWVQVPVSEGGGLAEREFLFREVGLERWLNGLDLEGHDAAAKVEKRRQKFERRRRRQQALQNGETPPDERRASTKRETLRYGGADAQSPVELVADSASDSDDSDDDLPESTGQIKVAMFRVLASGEIKKGEYSPQFDAHDDDEEYAGGDKSNANGAVDADVEHTTSFAKPKTLDPKTISTQTVTGIDGPDKPYATFTFLYRGERQLQKMGVIASSKTPTAAAANTKRRSTQLDFSNLGPLKTGGTVGFSAFRDNETESARRRRSRKKSNGSLGGAMDEDSDDDEDSDRDMAAKLADTDDKEDRTRLGPDDAKFSGELAEGVGRIKLKRAHSAEPESAGASRKSPSAGPFGGEQTPPLAPTKEEPPAAGATPFSQLAKSLPDESVVGSPFKKHRASVAEGDGNPGSRPGGIFSPPALGDVLAKAEAAQKQQQQEKQQQQHQTSTPEIKVEEEEEL